VSCFLVPKSALAFSIGLSFCLEKSLKPLVGDLGLNLAGFNGSVLVFFCIARSSLVSTVSFKFALSSYFLKASLYKLAVFSYSFLAGTLIFSFLELTSLYS